MKPCPCGSGKPREDLVDARGIFCTFVCEECEDDKRSRYNLNIFTDPAYDADEPIEDN